MQELIKFLVEHWELSLAFLVVLSYWIFSEIAEARSGHGVSPSQLVHLLNRENAVIIDMRDEKVYDEGHIIGALSFPGKSIIEQLNKIKKYQSKPVILVDTNGTLAQKNFSHLIKEGYEKTKYLKNGMQSWLDAKLPLEKKGKNHGKS